jgi:acyl-CoA synthetase (AMP-forming)/AMP-acid ligase II
MDRLVKVHGNEQLIEEADGGLRVTYLQAAKRVNRWAGGIAAKVDPGQPVVIAAANGYEQLLLCLAASRAGAIPAPVNPSMRREEVAHVVADSGASLVIHSAADVDGESPLFEAVPTPVDSVAALFYTSGTTGKPKGAALTHKALVGQLGGAAMWPARLHRDEAIIALPVAHIMGFATLLGLACAGIPVYFLPSFHPVAVLDAIEQRRGTIFVGVPAMYRMMFEAGAGDRDLTSIRVFASGADVMPSELAARFKKMGATATLPIIGPVGEAMFAEGYGMVEVGGGVATKLSPPFLGAGLGESIGFSLPGYKLRVVDEAGDQVGNGEVGEIQVKGPGVLKGYWGDDAASAAVLTDDGWLRTGDLARKGPLGLLMFEGREKDVIKRGGYSVYAVEIEHALEEHPQVLEAAVVALPDERVGEVPGAAVRLVPGAKLSKLGLGAWAAERLAEYKVPTRFVAVTELPRTGTRKVQKAALKELFD